MKNIFKLFLLSAFLVTGCYDAEIENLREEVKTLKDTQIATLEQQVKNVMASYDKLVALKDETKTLIAKLEGISVQLSADLTKVSDQLSSLQNDITKKLGDTDTELANKLQGVKSSLESRLADVNSTIKVLKEKDEALQKKIDDLKTYSDGTFAKKDWAEGTFATLESQNAILSDIATIKKQIETLSENLVKVEKEITELVDAQVAEARKTLDADLASKVQTLSEAYKAAISKTRSELSAAYSESTKKAVEELESKLTSWVNEQLTGYYTVAQAEAQVAAFMSLIGNVPAGKSIQSQLDELAEQLAKAEAQIRQDYQKAIKEAIETSAGKMSVEIDKQIADFREKTLDPISSRIDTVGKEIEKLWTEVGNLDKSVKTVEEQTEAILKSLKVLSDLKMTLKEYVAAVRKELEDADLKNFNELSGLVDDLQKLVEGSDPASLTSQIAALKAYVGTLPEGETDIVTWVAKTRDNINEQFKLYCTLQDLDSFKKTVEALLAGHTTKLGELETKLSTLIDDSRSTIDSWIVDALKPYWTTDELTGKIATLKADLSKLITDSDSEISKKIATLSQDIKDAQQELLEEYTRLISKAITEYDGIATEKIQKAIKARTDEINSLNNRLDLLDADIEQLQKDAAEVKVAVEDLEARILTLQAFIKDAFPEEAGFTKLDDFINHILSEISKTTNTYASLADLEAFKAVVQGLSDQLDLLDGDDGLVAQLTDAENVKDKLLKFMDGYLGGETPANLKDILDAINGDISSLWDVVFGKGEEKSLQDMINDIKKALYGAGMDKDNPEQGSIWYELKYLVDRIVTSNFTSVSYIPAKFDGFTYFTNNKATFNFLVRPVELAPVLVEASKISVGKGESKKVRMVYIPTTTRIAVMKDFEDVVFSSSEGGVLTAVVTVDNTSFVEEGASAALYVDLISEDTPTAVNFTSNFIPLGINKR